MNIKMNYQITKKCIVCQEKLILLSESTFKDCVCVDCAINECHKCGEILSARDWLDGECSAYKFESEYVGYQCLRLLKNKKQCPNLGYATYSAVTYCVKHFDKFMAKLKCAHGQNEDSCYKCNREDDCGLLFFFQKISENCVLNAIIIYIYAKISSRL